MSLSDQRPGYDTFGTSMLDGRGPLAEKLCLQLVQTVTPFLSAPMGSLSVLDVGCGYGHTALELAKRCRRVVGIEPSKPLADLAVQLAANSGCGHLSFRHGSVEDLDEVEAYDLVVLDNVLEHLPDAQLSLELIHRSLKPGGVVYIVCPNKLWPIEHHYYLPFLSYLPLAWANRYLRLSGRGTDYEDASYAPTLAGFRRLFRRIPGFELHLVPPADVSLTMAGGPWHYRLGTALLKRLPVFWWISKIFLAVAVKAPAAAESPSTG